MKVSDKLLYATATYKNRLTYSWWTNPDNLTDDFEKHLEDLKVADYSLIFYNGCYFLVELKNYLRRI